MFVLCLSIFAQLISSAVPLVSTNANDGWPTKERKSVGKDSWVWSTLLNLCSSRWSEFASNKGTLSSSRSDDSARLPLCFPAVATGWTDRRVDRPSLVPAQVAEWLSEVRRTMSFTAATVLTFTAVVCRWINVWEERVTCRPLRDRIAEICDRST